MAIITLSDTNVYNYPDLNLPEEKKGKFWNMKFGRAMLSDFMNRRDSGDWYHGRAKYNENRLYSTGEQGFDRYFNYSNPEGEKTPQAKAQRPWVTLGLKPLRIAPKYFNIVHDKLDQVKFDAICTAIDTLAQNEKETFAATLRAKMENRDFFQSLPVDGPNTSEDADIPQDEDDFEARLDLYKNESARNLEKKIKKVTIIDNDWEQLDYEADEDILETGRNLFHDYTRNGKHYVKRIRPDDGLIFPSQYPDYRDISKGGYFEYLTIADLKAEAGKEFSEEQYEKIAVATGWMGSRVNYDPSFGNIGGGMPYDSQKIQVLRYFFKSANYLPGMAPAKTMKEPDPDTKNDKPSPELPETGVLYQSWYEGNIVIGTDYGFGCRKSFNQKRNWNNQAEADPPLHAFKVKSVMADDIKSPIDHIMTNWIALNDIIARAVPPGYKYDVDALENIAMGSAGSDGKPTALTLPEIIGIHRATGDFFYRSKDLQGNNTQDGYGITQMDGGLPEDMVKRYNNIREGVALLESITINEVAVGNNPNPEMGKGTSEIALQAAAASMGYLYRVKNKRYERVTKALANRIKANEARNPVVGSYTAANNRVVTVGPDPNLPDRQIFIKIENRPTQEEWQDLYDKAQRLLDNKEITFADYIAVKAVDNLKEAWFIASTRQKQNEKKMLQMQRENQQMTFEGQAKAAQEAEMAKQQTMEVKFNFDAQLEQLKAENARVLQQMILQGQYQQELLRVQGRAEDKDTDVNSRTAEKILQMQHEKEMADKQAELTPAQPATAE